MKPEELKQEAGAAVKQELRAADAPALEVIDLPATLTDRLLMRVRQRRRTDDEREGFMRDYPDGTRGRRFKGPALEQDAQGLADAHARLKEASRNASPSWRHHLELALAYVVQEADEPELEKRLLELAAVAVAWAEAIEMRADRRRIDADAARRRQLRVVSLETGGQMVLRDASAPASSSRESWLRQLLNWFRRA